MSSAIWFNLDQSKILMSGNGLTVSAMPVNTHQHVQPTQVNLGQTRAVAKCDLIPTIDTLKIYGFGNIVRKGEIACNKQFLLFSQCFLPYMALIFHFKCTLKCRLQFSSIWTSLKFCCLVMG